jgi:hypothetical protein
VKIYLLFILFALAHIIQAQNHSDCITSIEICTLDPITVLSHQSQGQMLENINPPCEVMEINSTWFTFSFSSPGVFYFTITPSELLADIDFVVFESSDDCDEKLSVRCMLAGENIGAPVDSVCLGPTGLSPGSTDLLESPGCQNTNDNFLAPLNVDAGALYYLMVIDFNSGGGTYYTLNFTSTAELYCNPVSVPAENTIKDDIILFPNPASDQIELILTQPRITKMQVRVFDSYGRKYTEKEFNSFEQIMLNTDQLPAGAYIVHLLEDNVLARTLPFVKM